MRARLQRGWAMKKVTVNKGELLTKVRENHAKHLEDYAEAFEGYKQLATEKLHKARADINRQFDELQSKVQKAELGLDDPVALGLSWPHWGDVKRPVCHGKDYLQAVKMLEMSVDETVTLEADEFACFVLDDWDWKSDFLETSNFYKTAVSAPRR